MADAARAGFRLYLERIRTVPDEVEPSSPKRATWLRCEAAVPKIPVIALVERAFFAKAIQLTIPSLQVYQYLQLTGFVRKLWL